MSDLVNSIALNVRVPADHHGHGGHSSDDNYPGDGALPAGMHEAMAANAAAVAAGAAIHGAGSGEEMDYSEEDGEQEMHAMHDHDDLLEDSAHVAAAAEVAAAAGLAADLHMQVNAAAEAAANAEAAAGGDEDAAAAAAAAGVITALEEAAAAPPDSAGTVNGGNNNGNAPGERDVRLPAEGREQQLPAPFQPPARASPRSAAAAAAALEFQNMAEAEMEEERLLPLALRRARDLRDTVAEGDDLHDRYTMPLHMDDMPPGVLTTDLTSVIGCVSQLLPGGHEQWCRQL